MWSEWQIKAMDDLGQSWLVFRRRYDGQIQVNSVQQDSYIAQIRANKLNGKYDNETTKDTD